MIPEDLIFIFLVWNASFIPMYYVKAFQDDISAKTIPIWLHHTVQYIFKFMVVPVHLPPPLINTYSPKVFVASSW